MRAARAALLLALLVASPAPAEETIVIGSPVDPRAPSGSQRTIRPTAAAGVLTEIGELIELSPGAHLRRRGGVGAPVTVSLRGAGGHQVRVLVDGIPLDLARGGAVDLSSVPVGALASITVLRGAQGASYGSGAQGGVLSLRLRHDPAPEVSARIGSFGLAQLDGAGGSGQTVAAVQLSRAEGDFGFTDVNGARRVRQNQDHRRIGALLRQRVGEVSVLAQGLVQVRGEPGLEQFEGDGRSVTRQGLLGVGWQREGFELAGWWMQRRYAFEQTAVALAGQVDRADLGDARQGLRARYTHAGEGVRASVETSAEREATDERARVRGAITPSFIWGRRTRMTGALRVDALDTRDPIVAPHLGFVAPIQQLEIRANLGRLFRDPSIDELYFSSAGVRGNPALRPEDGWGGDLGLRWRRAGLDLEVTGFGQRFDRLILFVPVSAWLIEAQDGFGATAWGVEAALRARWDRYELRALHLEQRVRADEGPPVPFRPDRSSTVRLTARLGWGLRLFGLARRSGAVTTDAFGNRTLDAWLRWDAGVTWRRGAWRIGLEGRNLGDARILDALQQPQPGRRWLLGIGWQG